MAHSDLVPPISEAIKPRDSVTSEPSLPLQSVVQVTTVANAPDYEQPWQSRGPETSQGSGVIVETPRGLRILTNAHCVEHHVFVEVRRYGESEKVVAEVEAIGHECDLALLHVEDEGFFEGAAPIEIAPLPHLGERVRVYGFPVGGERLSVTEGIVSRIDLIEYAQSQRRLLAVQIDAAINSGNSGGPVIRDGKLVGVCFQSLEEGEAIGYMVAPTVVVHFLTAVALGSYTGFPALSIRTQALESPTLRKHLGLTTVGRSADGILITGVAFGGSAHGIIEVGDVLLDVDGVKVASTGTVKFRGGEIISFSHLISQRQMGETVPLGLFRAGKHIRRDVALSPPAHLVRDDRLHASGPQEHPSYLLVGGFLFAPLTRNYLKLWGEQWWQRAPHDLMRLYEDGIRSAELQEPVVLQKVLADSCNRGYHHHESLLIVEANGEPLRSLSHLVSIVDDGGDATLKLRSNRGRLIVIDRALAQERESEIHERFLVPDDRSPDLKRP